MSRILLAYASISRSIFVYLLQLQYVFYTERVNTVRGRIIIIIIIIITTTHLLSQLPFPLVHLLLNHWCIPPLRLQVSHCSTYLIMCVMSLVQLICTQCIDCYPGIVSNTFSPFVTIPVVSSSSSSSCLTQVRFPLVLLPLNRWCTPSLRLQASHCSTFLIMCDVSGAAVSLRRIH